MKPDNLIVIACVLAALLLATSPADLAGDWKGALDVGGTSLHLTLHLAAGPGKFTATLDSEDQGAYGVPVQRVTLEGSTLRLELPQLGAGFEGKLNGNSTEVSGRWSQSGANLPLVFRRASPQKADAATPDVRTRRALDLLLNGKEDVFFGMCTPEMQKAVSLAYLRLLMAQIKSPGPPKSPGAASVHHAGDDTEVTIPLHWNTSDLNFRVQWTSDGKIAGAWFTPPAGPWQPPAYCSVDSFTEQEVTVGEDEWKLPGTLTLPKQPGRVPAVVLVQGSGPQDRDETIGGAKIFKDLACGLASRGIAVLRYEKRTKVYPARCAADPNFTVNQETVEDALRAAALLRTRPEVDSHRVFVLGHSLAGYMVPRIAARDPKLAGVIGMAGNVRPIEELVADQAAYMETLTTDPGRKKQFEAVRMQAEEVSRLQPGQAHAPLAGMPVNYLLALRGYDPAEEMRRLPTPVLLLQGERDFQITMKDFALWKAALSGRKDATLRSFPSLNHLFETGEGKSVPAEYENPGHVAPEAVEETARWILAH